MLWSRGLYALAPLPIYIFEIKPLIYQDKNVLKGSWFESFEKLETLSGLDFSYQFMSVSRMDIFLIGKEPGCSLTLTKTPEREKMKINFIAEHSDKKQLSLYQRGDDKRQFTLKTLKSFKNLKLATATPSAIPVFKALDVQLELLFNFNSIIRMLLLKRLDGVVAPNFAIEKLDEFKTGKIKKSFIIKTTVHGIACSPGTPPEYISRLKKAAKHWSLDQTILVR